MEETILQILQQLKQEFKFFEITDGKVASWIEFLGDIPQDQLYASTIAYISDGGDKAPTWGMIRNKALLLEDKALSVTASMAWGRVLFKIKNPKATLTALEQRALDCTCDIYSLRQKNVNDLSYDRTFFIRHYEELRNMEIKKIVATPQVDNLLGGSDVRRLRDQNAQ